jgi:micrococcal nuclease
VIALILAAALTFDYPATVVSAVDGDTIKVTIADWPTPFRPIDIRIVGIDAPEHAKPLAKSSCEVKLGLKAQAYARSIVQPGDQIVAHYTTGTKDKYLRLLASVTLPDGSDFAARMISAGMARPYGGAAGLSKGLWCKSGKPLPINP